MEKDHFYNNGGVSGVEETNSLMAIAAIGICVGLFLLISLGILVGGYGDDSYYPPTPAVNQIYIDVDTDGGCIGCVWNR